MATRKGPDPAPEERLEADRRYLEYLALACGEEAGLHRPLNETVGGLITGIPEEADLAQALSDRETCDILVHLLDENREQVEHALERVREGAYGICGGLRQENPGGTPQVPAGSDALRRLPVAMGPHEWENCVASAKPAPQVSPRGGPAAGDAMGASKFGSRLPRSPGRWRAAPEGTWAPG